MGDVLGGSRHVGEENVDLVTSFFVLLPMVNAKLFELVERSAVDVQHLGVLGDALEERGAIGELEVVEQRIQEGYAPNHAIEVQCTAEGGMSEHADGAKDFLTLDEGNLRCILVAEPFAPSDVVIVIELPIARKHVIRMKRGVKIRARIGGQRRDGVPRTSDLD
jgi:hypothetical protein